ncbi:MAG: DUF6173 family protein [Rhodobacter sp.]|nr:DUF6173 family protein [Rhodobacter sp.]
MSDAIETTAEAHEAQAMPRAHAVHADPRARPTCEDLPLPQAVAKTPVQNKSPAEWAYERLILYIKNFEEQLDNEHEVAMGFTGADAGVIRIEGIGYFDPDIVTFYGSDPSGTKTQLIQHVTQLNVMLRALPKAQGDGAPKRIGFRLAADLEAE